MNVVRICKVLAISFICWVYFSDPMGLFLWCTYSIWMTRLYVLGSIRTSGRIEGSL